MLFFYERSLIFEHRVRTSHTAIQVDKSSIAFILTIQYIAIFLCLEIMFDIVHHHQVDALLAHFVALLNLIATNINTIDDAMYGTLYLNHSILALIFDGISIIDPSGERIGPPSLHTSVN